MATLSFFTTWSVGLFSGYSRKDPNHQDLPSGIKYGTMALASGLNIVKAIGSLEPTKLTIRPGPTLAGIFIGIPLVIGSTYCLGNHFGKALQHMDSNKKQGANQGSVRISLFGSEKTDME